MDLFLIRHGQSFNNTLLDGKGRVADPPLTEIGERQADRVALHLRDEPAKIVFGEWEGNPCAGYGITRLYASAMFRCLQTAEPIGKALGLKPEIWTDFHEESGIWLEGGGPLPGLTASEISERFPDVVLSDEMTPQGWWNRPRETKEECVQRARRVAARLKGMADGEKRIAVVGHGAFTRNLLAELLHGGPLVGGDFATRNTSIGHIHFGPDVFHISFLNRVEHLPADLVT